MNVQQPPPLFVPVPIELVPIKVDRHCASCGYGAYLPVGAATSCPMCGGGAWLLPR